MVLNIETGESNISNHKLTRMKKEEIINFFRDMETKHYEMWKANILIGNTAEKEIENVNEELAVAEAENHKFKQTIQELNETNNKLVKRVKYFEEKKELDKKRAESPPKIMKKIIQMNDALEKQNENLESQITSLESKNGLLEDHNKSLIEECKRKNEENEDLEEEVQKWKQQVDINYKLHYEELEPLLLKQEEDKRIRTKCVELTMLLQQTNHTFNEILKSHQNPNVMVQMWIEDTCVEVDNIIDGVNEYAPSEFENLYADFKEWVHDRKELNPPDKKSVKEALKDWQKNSKYGLSIGMKKSSANINGYEAKPRFNLKVI